MQVITVCSPYSQDRSTGHSPRASVEWNWLCWDCQTLVHNAELKSYINRSGEFVTWTHSPNWLWFMPNKIHPPISKMDYALCDGFLELFKAEYLPASFKLNSVEAEFLPKPHLLIPTCNIMNICFRWFTMWTVSAILKIVASVYTSDGLTWNSKSLLGVVFTTL